MEYAPFFVSRNVGGLLITKSDPEYWSLRNEIQRSNIPTQGFPIERDGVSAWVDGTNIGAANSQPETPLFFCDTTLECLDEITVLEGDEEIRNLDFYKDRNDVLLMSAQNGVFAIEIDRRGFTQNFQPVYKGTQEPRFIVKDNELYVLDGELLFIVSL